MSSVFNKLYYQGEYVPVNKDKCINCTNSKLKIPFYRSSWELKFMRWLDKRIDVLEWGSECQMIDYYSDQDNKMHTYFPDFYMKVKDKDNEIVKYMIEVKPKSQSPKLDENNNVKYPSLPKNKTNKNLSRWSEKTAILHRNNEKWAAAKHYCSTHAMIFKVLNEDDLF
jgi:hypothetical protein